MEMTELDYPAAHSMDTVWYAVDESGNIAAFSTGSEGSLPKAAMNLEEDVYLEGEIRKTAARGETVLHLDELFSEPHEPLDSLKPVKPSRSHTVNSSAGFWKRLFKPKHTWQVKRCLILFHSSLDINQQPWKPSAVLPHYNGKLAEFDDESVGPTVEQYGQLLKDGMISRVWANRTISERDVGLFQYYCGNDSESETCDLPRDQYTRYFVPKHPIQVDQLPTNLRDALYKAKIPLNFAAADTIVPTNLRDALYKAKIPLNFAAADTIEVGKHFSDLLTYDLDDPEEESM